MMLLVPKVLFLMVILDKNSEKTCKVLVSLPSHYRGYKEWK